MKRHINQPDLAEEGTFHSWHREATCAHLAPGSSPAVGRQSTLFKQNQPFLVNYGSISPSWLAEMAQIRRCRLNHGHMVTGATTYTAESADLRAKRCQNSMF